VKKILSALLFMSSVAKADILTGPVIGYLHFWNLQPIERCYENSCEPGFESVPGMQYVLKQDSRVFGDAVAIYKLTSMESSPKANHSLKMTMEVPLDLFQSPLYFDRRGSAMNIEIKIQVGESPEETISCLRNTYHLEQVTCYWPLPGRLAQLNLYVAK